MKKSTRPKRRRPKKIETTQFVRCGGCNHAFLGGEHKRIRTKHGETQIRCFTCKPVSGKGWHCPERGEKPDDF